jgi:uncharacterized protein YqgC (DUF456 family)
MPGTVVIFFDVLFYAIFTGFDHNHVGFSIVLFLLISTIIAETIDFLVMAGRYQPVTSKRSFGAAAIGAVTGSFLLTPFFWGTGNLGRIFFGRSCRNIGNRICPPIKIKGSFPNSRSRYYCYDRRKDG